MQSIEHSEKGGTLVLGLTLVGSAPSSTVVRLISTVVVVGCDIVEVGRWGHHHGWYIFQDLHR
jgi:hypothetical protein